MPDKTMLDLLRRGVSEHPEERLFRCGGEWQSYSAIDAASDLMAPALFEVGVRQGDRVATLATNRLELVSLVLACGKLGAIQVPLNPYLKGEFLRHQLADSGSVVLLADAAGIGTAAPVLSGTSVTAVVCLDDGIPESTPALGIPVHIYRHLAEASGSRYPGASPTLADAISIMYTSGTTGLPKGCIISHGYAVNSPESWFELGWIRHDDIVFTQLPLFHFAAQLVLAGAFVSGSPTVIDPRFSASTFIERAAQEGATMLRGVGAMAMAVLRTPEKPDDAAHGFRQGCFPPLSPEARARFERRFGIAVRNEIYGQTECIPAAIAPLAGDSDPNSCGKAAPSVELRIVDDEDVEVPVGGVGEIVVRPRRPYAMFSGYWNNPSATVQAWRNLWHHTGDKGRLDNDGNLFFVDRKKDAIRRRGENVSSMELEAAIRRHPAVMNAAAIAVPSELGEDEIKLLVVFDPDHPAPDAGEFFEFLKESLPYFAIPRFVVRQTELPATPTGRVQKHLLRQLEHAPELEWDFESPGYGVDARDRRTVTATRDGGLQDHTLESTNQLGH